MKRIILIFIICLLVSGCGKTEKNITINIYENNDKQEVTEEIKKEENKKDIEDENEIVKDNFSELNTESNDKKTTASKITEKVKDTYNGAKNWYNANKEELKDINNQIVENDKNTIDTWIDKTTSWYEENSDELKKSSEEIYNNDKKIIEDLYNKIIN